MYSMYINHAHFASNIVIDYVRKKLLEIYIRLEMLKKEKYIYTSIYPSICIYTCLHIHMHTYTYTHTHIHTNTRTYIYYLCSTTLSLTIFFKK